ncbi:MAG: hypothetical protein LUQ20_03130 [Candidatus Methanoperedens sp.]|nr:hypothetical protein [Candidatus Methanoperedens sp.]
MTKMVTAISGVTLESFEFLLYGIIGFLFATGLYIYTSKKFKDGGFLMVAAFFIIMTYFFNYQAVPFSLAFGVLLLLFVLETCQKTVEVKTTMLVLYASLLFTHAFVPLFFVLYLLVRSILNRSKLYGGLFVLTLVSYLIVQLTFGRLSFADNILSVMTRPAEYSQMIATTLSPLQVQVPIDAIAQLFSRGVTIAFLIISGIGFTLLLIERKTNSVDTAILLTGIIYSGLGIFLYTLGTRAISLIFIPVAIGAAYIFENRFKRLKPYLASIFLVLIILFTFVPVHQSFGTEVQFQPSETYVAQNFFIQHYDWSIGDSILLTYRVSMYFDSKVAAYINYSSSPGEAKIIFYTTGLGKDFGNYTKDQLVQQQRLNMVYDNAFSCIAITRNP